MHQIMYDKIFHTPSFSFVLSLMLSVITWVNSVLLAKGILFCSIFNSGVSTEPQRAC